MITIGDLSAAQCRTQTVQLSDIPSFASTFFVLQSILRTTKKPIYTIMMKRTAISPGSPLRVYLYAISNLTNVLHESTTLSQFIVGYATDSRLV